MSKKWYRVWATQELYDEDFVEAESLEEAEAIATRMFVGTGELDPEDINDSACGAVLMKDD